MPQPVYRRKKKINQNFRKLSWKEQQYFIINNTSKENSKRKTLKENRKLARNVTLSYFLSNVAGTKVINL